MSVIALQEIQEVLGSDPAKVFCDVYNIQKKVIFSILQQAKVKLCPHNASCWSVGVLLWLEELPMQHLV